MTPLCRFSVGFFISLFISITTSHAATVGKWRRHVVSLLNSTYSGNPFELEANATFTHTASGTTLTLPGYYAGSNTWKIGFMPTKMGEWNYVTTSTDPDLNGVTGSVNCVSSGLPGMLKADPENPKKWKFTDGPYAVPIGLRLDVFNEDASTSAFASAADFLKNEVKGHMHQGMLGNYVFSDWRSHQFDLARWNRLEERLEILTERGLGYHLMFYTDDAGKPEWSGQSDTERLLIRYVIARLAGYPIVWFNTGIDIAEYRDQSWIDWFGDQIRSLDPYGHPVSSRYGGGSGNYLMTGQSWDSRGDKLAHISNMTRYFKTASVPVSMDDAWGENRPSHPEKNFRPEDIRRAFWKCVAAGGLGALIKGSVYWFSIRDVESDLESEQWLRLVNPFITKKLGDSFGLMVSDQSLVSNGYCLADPARTRILYFLTGQNDKWDSGNGGTVTLKLAGLTEYYSAKWFDPRSGVETELGFLEGGMDHVINPPSTDDWVLLLTRQTDTSHPAPSTALRIITVE